MSVCAEVVGIALPVFLGLDLWGAASWYRLPGADADADAATVSFQLKNWVVLRE